MYRGEREITKDMYDRAIANRQYLAKEDYDKVFTTAELCGYGVYRAMVKEVDGKYVVVYHMGNSCD